MCEVPRRLPMPTAVVISGLLMVLALCTGSASRTKAKPERTIFPVTTSKMEKLSREIFEVMSGAISSAEGKGDEVIG